MIHEIVFSFRTVCFALTAAWLAQRARCVVYHDSVSLLAEPAVRQMSAAVAFADVTEDMDLSERTSGLYRRYHPRLLAILHRRMAAALARMAAVTTVGTGFVKRLQADGVANVYHVTNYESSQLAPLMPTCPEDLRIAFPSVFSSETGAAFVLSVLEAAPRHWHLRVIGSAYPADAPPDLRARIEALGARIVFLPPMARADYLAEIQACDIGWILFAANRRNLRLGLPNRFQDLVSVGVPVVATEIPSVLPYLQALPFGAAVPFGDVAGVLEQTAAWSGRSYGPPSRACFDAVVSATGFEAVLPRAEGEACRAAGARPEAAIVAMRGLAHRRRVVQICRALVALGWQVRVICRRTPPVLPAEDWTQHVSLSVIRA
jgi:hypothetical protein